MTIHNEDKTIKSLIPLLPSKLETVDFAMYDFIINLKLSCTTNKGWRLIPVVWAGRERAKQAKDDPDVRDISEALIFPIISIDRETPNKSIPSKGKFYANIPPVDDPKGGSILIARRIKQDKTANFSNADSFRKRGGPIHEGTDLVNEGIGPGQINFPSKRKKTVYETASMPQPVYYEVNYKIKIKTEYQQQMNELLSPFIVKPGSVNRVMIARDGYRYEAFIQPEFTTDNNTKEMSEEVRKFETEITIKVFGYLLGADANEDRPNIAVRETVVEVKIGREQVIVGDLPIFNQTGNPLKPGKFRP